MWQAAILLTANMLSATQSRKVAFHLTFNLSPSTDHMSKSGTGTMTTVHFSDMKGFSTTVIRLGHMTAICLWGLLLLSHTNGIAVYGYGSFMWQRCIAI